MPELSLQFLGVPELVLDGVSVHLRRRHSLALLAYLVLTRRAHTREELAALLTDNVPDEPARKLVRNALSDLSNLGFGPFLVVSRQSVAFNVAAQHTLDVQRLTTLGTQVDTASPATLRWIAERCDQELLAGLVVRDAPFFETWLVREREHLRQEQVRLAQQVLERQLRDGRLHEGIVLARKMLVIEPWHEQFHRVLMRLLARDGQLTAALAQYERCRTELANELGVEPQPETTALYDRLRSGPSAPRTNLPAGRSGDELIGREDALASIVQTFSGGDCHLLTIVGLGGSGKTALALAVAEQLAQPAAFVDDHPFADGVILVNLADVPPPEADSVPGDDAARRLVTAIGLALGMVFYGKVDRLEQVLAFIRTKHLLLVLDGAEHLVQGSGAVQTIVRTAPGVRVLATSRTPLGIADEWLYELGGLPVPAGPADLEQSPAGRLFLREARRSGARPTVHDSPAIARICRLTGGLPLALRLVAGWLHALSFAEVVAELETGGLLLAEPAPGLERPYLSLRALMESACDDLPEQQQRALRRLAIFPGRFDLAAAQALDVSLPVLLALSQRSLVERDRDGGFTLHPLIRRYCSQALESVPNEYELVADQHAAYYAQFMLRQTPALYQRPEAFSAIRAELVNLQASWNWGVSQANLELLEQVLEGMTTWHQLAGLHHDWSVALAAARVRLGMSQLGPVGQALLVRLLAAEADALLWQGELDRAAPLLVSARELAAELDQPGLDAVVGLVEGRVLRFRGGEDQAAVNALLQACVLAQSTRQQRIEASCLMALSFAAADSERYAEAESYLQRAEMAYRVLGDRLSMARTAHHRGRLCVARADYARAKVYVDQSLHVALTFGDHLIQGLAHSYLGIISDNWSGRHREADESFERALVIAMQSGDPHLLGNIFRPQGRNALHIGDLSRARSLFEQAVALGRDVGNSRALCDALLGLGQVALIEGELDTAAERAQQSMRLAEEMEHPHSRALALFLLGMVREQQGQFAAADGAYGQVLTTATTLGLPHLRCDAMTGLTSIALIQRNVWRARTYAGELYDYVHQHALAGCFEPGWVALTCAEAFRASGDERASDVAQLGAALLETRVKALPALQRFQYLAAFPARRTLLSHWSDQSPTGAVRQAERATGRSPLVRYSR